MANDLKAGPLHQHMAHMLNLEAEVAKTLEPLLEHGQPEIAALARDIHAATTAQQSAVAARLQEIAGDGVAAGEFEDPLQGAQLAILTALAGYAKMQVLARRFGHASAFSEGATDDIALQHIRNYIGALQGINNVLHDNVVSTLDGAGISCQCPCPSCSLGVCLCAVSSHHVQRDAWASETPAQETGVFVHSPPADSAAAKGGLRHGDVIQSADGRKVDAYSNLQQVVKGHAPGETIKLQVSRGPEGLLDLEVVRP